MHVDQCTAPRQRVCGQCQPPDVVRGRRISGGAEFGQIGTGAEGPPDRSQLHARNIRVERRERKCLEQRVAQRPIDRVQRAGPIDHDAQRRAFAGQVDPPGRRGFGWGLRLDPARVFGAPLQHRIADRFHRQSMIDRHAFGSAQQLHHGGSGKRVARHLLDDAIEPDRRLDHRVEQSGGGMRRIPDPDNRKRRQTQRPWIGPESVQVEACERRCLARPGDAQVRGIDQIGIDGRHVACIPH